MDSRLSAKGKAQQEEVRYRKHTPQGSGYSTPQVSSRDTSRDTQQERPQEEQKEAAGTTMEKLLHYFEEYIPNPEKDKRKR